MLYSVSSAKYPLIYASSGMLYNEDHFLHPDRVLDTYVLILVHKGTLFISMNGHEYEVGPNHFVVLFPGMRHCGTKPSSGQLVYYWMHFSIQDPDVSIREMSGLQTNGLRPGNFDVSDTEYILPACGYLYDDRKSELIFQNLLDMTKRDHYAVTWRCHYLASYLVLEIMHEMQIRQTAQNEHLPEIIVNVLEFIRTHYADDISTGSIAQQFGYHSVYLERLFKKSTGSSLTRYINGVRIEASKNLLLNSIESLESVAASCGFSDVKYYMRVFRQYVGMTPTQYRKNLSQRKINIQ